MSDKYSEEAINHGVDAPAWIDSGITLGDIIAIADHGCASGAYMPAVTYYEAKRTIGMWGDEITDYIGGEGCYSCSEILQNASAEESYSRMCCALLSFAVELWCHRHYDEAQSLLDGDEDEDREVA